MLQMMNLIILTYLSYSLIQIIYHNFINLQMSDLKQLLTEFSKDIIKQMDAKFHDLDKKLTKKIEDTQDKLVKKIEERAKDTQDKLVKKIEERAKDTQDKLVKKIEERAKATQDKLSKQMNDANEKNDLIQTQTSNILCGLNAQFMIRFPELEALVNTDFSQIMRFLCSDKLNATQILKAKIIDELDKIENWRTNTQKAIRQVKSQIQNEKQSEAQKQKWKLIEAQLQQISELTQRLLQFESTINGLRAAMTQEIGQISKENLKNSELILTCSQNLGKMKDSFEKLIAKIENLKKITQGIQSKIDSKSEQNITQHDKITLLITETQTSLQELADRIENSQQLMSEMKKNQRTASENYNSKQKQIQASILFIQNQQAHFIQRLNQLSIKINHCVQDYNKGQKKSQEQQKELSAFKKQVDTFKDEASVLNLKVENIKECLKNESIQKKTMIQQIENQQRELRKNTKFASPPKKTE